MEQSTFQPGDICFECQQQGLSNRLRTFYIDINEEIVKCESSSCIYPYINDFSDSEEDVPNKDFKNSPSLSSSDLCSYHNSDFDELDSIRFVEALLCIDGKNTAEDFGTLSTVTEKSAPLFLLQNTNHKSPTGLHSHNEMPSSYSLKSNTSQTNIFSKDTSDVKEGVSFIDNLFSNYKTDKSSALNMTSLTTQGTSVTFDKHEKDFDFIGIPPTTEHCQLDVNKESKHIEIQCIQTVKAAFAKPECNAVNSVANESKISISSMEFIKTDYIKDEASKPADKTEKSTATPQANVSAGGTRISRYFDALRLKQEKLQKSQSKHTLVDHKKRSKGHIKSNTATGSSLINVLHLLQTKKKK